MFVMSDKAHDFSSIGYGFGSDVCEFVVDGAGGDRRAHDHFPSGNPHS